MRSDGTTAGIYCHRDGSGNLGGRVGYTLAVILSNIWFLQTCSAQTVDQRQLLDYGTYSGFALEKGIVGTDYYSPPKASCIHGVISSLKASHSAASISIVTSADEYSKAFHVEQNATASYLGVFGGDDDIHLGRTQAGSSSKFDIVVEVGGETNSETIDHVEWDQQYASILALNTPAARQRVRLACGDRYIGTVFNQVRLYAVLHVSNQKQSALTTIDAKFNGHANMEIASATAHMGGDLNISSANRDGAITIEVYSEGLDGPLPTAAIVGIGSSDGIQEIVNRLTQYLADPVHKAVGQPVKYQLTMFPSMDGSDLYDGRMLQRLALIKSDNYAAQARLQNVDLLLGSDERRMILKQPEADSELRRVQAALNKYIDLTAQVHEICRQSLTVARCSKAMASASSPDASRVELLPIGPPAIDSFQFLVDGESVPPGHNAQIIAFTDGATLLSNARKWVKPTASSVDLVAAVHAPYMSFIDVGLLVTGFGYPPYLAGPPIFISEGRLSAADLSWPSTAKQKQLGDLAVHVLHADSANPCTINRTGAVTEPSCLTKVGLFLLDIAKARVAQTNAPGTTITFGVQGISTDCFGNSSSAPKSVLYFSGGNSHYQGQAAETQIMLLMGPNSPAMPLAFTLITDITSRTPKEWAEFAATRTPIYLKQREVTDLCSAHIQ